MLVHLRRLITVGGPISIARYMSEALSHPRYGYYATREPFGAGGDFVTAPEVSQMFGELLGLWSAQTWLSMGAPTPFALVELGPGRATLMADALRAAATVPGFIDACCLHLVENSPRLREIQRQTLGARAAVWHDRWPDLAGIPAIVLANEFFDALPIHQFQRKADRWHERLIAADAEGLTFALSETSVDSTALRQGAAELPDGCIVEVAPARHAMMADIAAHLAAAGGAALVIDYGYAQPGSGDTLQAVRGHSYHEVLAEPGRADITAHVDFGALAGAAADQGARSHGPVLQGAFLCRLGIEARAAALCKQASVSQAKDIVAAHDRLISETEMGSLFKVLAVTAAALPTPAGFEHLS